MDWTFKQKNPTNHNKSEGTDSILEVSDNLENFNWRQEELQNLALDTRSIKLI